MSVVYFFIGPMLHHPPWSPTYVGNEPRRNPFALVETGIKYQYTHARSMIPSLCQMLVLVML